MEPVSNAGGRMYACCLLQACDGSSPWLQFPVFLPLPEQGLPCLLLAEPNRQPFVRGECGFRVSQHRRHKGEGGVWAESELIASKANLTSAVVFPESALTWNIFSSSGFYTT